ncbi:TetR/AcrR family transcriptional regulator [Aliidiomarina minuta]|uniref:TetR/AcrR family transcriptional regulator n=1 Tax=Aliidiomarina minuta TaxID=880057 RepID=A0A432W3A3_9GAMM|nr:TetR/AcrR family transcriptional regulator [Aliidiomarina minuta]RUO23854.1 TetR/AcrR family transcriptional regulator [Aliidiomarina minuta]
MVSKQKIIQQALKQGETTGWERLTLADIAHGLDVKLAEIHHHFAQKDDIVDAWLDCADQALLKQAPNPEWTGLSGAERLHKVLWLWLSSMSDYRKVTGEMLLYKLEPGHVHLQLAGILRISRTVQWFREAAALQASHLQRIGQELALTKLFVATFVRWLNDSSNQQQRTYKYLEKRLAAGQRLNLWK